MAETLYIFFNERVLEWENLAEAANNHQIVLIYNILFLRQTYLCSEYEKTRSMTANQYIAYP
jgi:hypothetical protein